MSVITLPNGMILDDKKGMASSLNDWCKRWNIHNDHRVFLATEPSGRQCYILVEGENVVYESQQSEAIACKIDVIGLSRKDDPE